jgi:hypothetical protein
MMFERRTSRIQTRNTNHSGMTLSRNFGAMSIVWGSLILLALEQLGLLFLHFDVLIRPTHIYLSHSSLASPWTSRDSGSCIRTLSKMMCILLLSTIKPNESTSTVPGKPLQLENRVTIHDLGDEKLVYIRNGYGYKHEAISKQ